MSKSPELNVTEPVGHHPDGIVRNVYEDKGQPDEGSVGNFSQYIVERAYGKDSPTADSYIPGTEYLTKSVREFYWKLNPKKAIAATLIATTAFFGARLAVENVDSAVGKTGETIQDIRAMFQDKQRTIPGKKIEDKVRPVTRTFKFDGSTSEQASGIAEQDKEASEKIVSEVKKLGKEGSVKSISITGNTSDEWTENGIKSLGKKDKKNTDLGIDRAEALGENIKAEADSQNVDLPNIKVESNESILENVDLAELFITVQDSSYAGILEAVTAYNNKDPEMSPELRRTIKNMLGQERYGLVTINAEEYTPGRTEEITIPERTVDIKREDEKHPFDMPFPCPIIIPPIPWWRRKDVATDFPTTVAITPDPTVDSWIQLYDRGVKSKRVVDAGWSETRKYQYLMRENRISQGLIYEYADDDGEEQKINVLFSDRDEITPETKKIIDDLMFKISLMQEGKVGNDLDTIVIYPTEQTGEQPRPDRIGLGIDDQYSTGTLGVAIPVIGLAEIHIPSKPTDKDIEGYQKLNWVFAHEIAGHFTDIDFENARALTVSEEKVKGLKQTYQVKGSFDGSGNDMFNTTAHPDSVEEKQYEIRNQRTGQQELHFETDVDETTTQPKRLHEIKPTRYAGTNPEETYAETAASLVSETAVPGEAVGIDTGVSHQVDRGLQERYVANVGAVPNQESLVFDPSLVNKRRKTFRVTQLSGVDAINRSAYLNQVTESSKKTPYQPDKKRVAIGTKISY